MPAPKEKGEGAAVSGPSTEPGEEEDADAGEEAREAAAPVAEPLSMPRAMVRAGAWWPASGTGVRRAKDSQTTASNATTDNKMQDFFMNEESRKITGKRDNGC